MVQIKYPVPYLLKTRIGRTDGFKDVADEIIREIPDVDSADAPMVFKCVQEWGRGRETASDSKMTASVRTFDGKFYAQCLAFDKDGHHEPRPLRPEDLGNLGQQSDFWLTPFEKPYLHQQQKNDGPSLPAERFKKYHAGELPRFESLGLKRTALGRKGLDEAVSKADADISKYINIDGQLWRQTRSEPALMFSRASRTMVIVSIIDNHPDHQQTEARSVYRIDRLDDGMDHVKQLMASYGVEEAIDWHFFFEDLKVYDNELLAFDDEKDSILRLAKRMYDPVHFQAIVYDATMTDEKKATVTEMGELILRAADGEMDRLVEIIKEFAADWPSEKVVLPADVPLLIERWELRPMHDSTTMKI